LPFLDFFCSGAVNRRDPGAYFLRRTCSMCEAVPPGLVLERFRGYLLLLTQLHWDSRLQGRLDPSDLVQQSLLEAHQKRDQFRGTSEAELAGWLRQILAHNLADEFRRLDRAKRDVNLERSLEDLLGESSSRLQACLAAEQSSPSQKVAENEELTRLAGCLAQLPDPQREAVTLHHLQGLTLGELARRMERSEAGVAGLIRRGLKKLRQLMVAQE
jgi:RNA polymerase sigma-70 factor (ECF subfamily)